MSALVLMSFELKHDKNLNPFHDTIIIIAHVSTSLISKSYKLNRSLYFIRKNQKTNLRDDFGYRTKGISPPLLFGRSKFIENGQYLESIFQCGI